MSIRGMVTVPSELKIILFSCFTKNNFAKSCFKATVEMTIQGEKQPLFSHYTRKIKGGSQGPKISFTTLLKLSHSVKVII